MISKEDINCCKNEARKYIKNMEELKDNAGWVRLLLWYINKLETKLKKYKLETIPQLQGELLVSKQVHEYDVQMIDQVKRKSSRIIQYN